MKITLEGHELRALGDLTFKPSIEEVKLRNKDNITEEQLKAIVEVQVTRRSWYQFTVYGGVCNTEVPKAPRTVGFV